MTFVKTRKGVNEQNDNSRLLMDDCKKKSASGKFEVNIIPTSHSEPLPLFRVPLYNPLQLNFQVIVHDNPALCTRLKNKLPSFICRSIKPHRMYYYIYNAKWPISCPE